MSFSCERPAKRQCQHGAAGASVICPVGLCMHFSVYVSGKAEADDAAKLRFMRRAVEDNAAVFDKVVDLEDDLVKAPQLFLSFSCVRGLQ